MEGQRGTGDLLTTSAARDVLRRAEVMAVAIETSRGPHVTPELFAVSGGRIWFAAARRTLKARVLRPGNAIGITITSRGRSLVIGGRALPLDPLDPASWIAAPAELLFAPLASVTFGLRNLPHLVGLAREGLAGLPRSPDTLRVLTSVVPERAALVSGDELEDVEGRWPGRKGEPTAGARRGSFTLPDVPSASIAEGERSAVVGVESPAGPLALPAQWEPDAARATVLPELIDLASPRLPGPACVMVEETKGFAMSGKRGVLLRGEASLARGAGTSLVFDVDRAVGWRGLETRAADAG